MRQTPPRTPWRRSCYRRIAKRLEAVFGAPNHVWSGCLLLGAVSQRAARPTQSILPAGATTTVHRIHFRPTVESGRSGRRLGCFLARIPRERTPQILDSRFRAPCLSRGRPRVRVPSSPPLQEHWRELVYSVREHFLKWQAGTSGKLLLSGGLLCSLNC